MGAASLPARQQPFEGTGNQSGDIEKDFKRFSKQPELFEVLKKFVEGFGPLPPASQGTKLVSMDIPLKKEFENTPLRGKCWPMPEEDVLEIEQQVEELIAEK